MNKYDTFWPRLVALFIDGIVLAILAFTLNVLVIPWIESISFLGDLVRESVSYVYAIVMVGYCGQTVGKMAMNIKVVDHDTEENVTYEQAFKREAIPLFLVVFSILLTAFGSDHVPIPGDESDLGDLISSLPLYLGFVWSLLEIITMLTDPKSRAFHDKIANTVVVKID